MTTRWNEDPARVIRSLLDELAVRRSAIVDMKVAASAYLARALFDLENRPEAQARAEVDDVPALRARCPSCEPDEPCEAHTDEHLAAREAHVLDLLWKEREVARKDAEATARLLLGRMYARGWAP